MPELPQVQGFVQYFKYTCLHKIIKKTQCDDDFIKNTGCSNLGRALKHEQFSDVYRKGKYLIAELETASYLLVLHFGMTGSLVYKRKDHITEDDKEYAKLIITFENQYQLVFSNVRKLGSVFLVTDVSEIQALKEMGPDPLELDESDFLHKLNQHNNKNIKSFLMDQSIIAGIGNEFSNEVLFQAEIDPHQKITEIKKKERVKLYSLMQQTLQEAIKIYQQNKDEPEFPNAWLLAHQKDHVCPKNKAHSLKKETIAGRSALFCPQHQMKD